MLSFQKGYFFLTIALFLTEVFIAIFVHDNIVRPYIGDFLVVILIYCFFRSFLKVPVLPLALSVLLFSYLVETLQYFNWVKHLGLQDSELANIVLGNSFQWIDILAFSLGIIVIIAVERLRAKKDFARLPDLAN